MAVDNIQINEKHIKSFSTNGKKIKPIFDRLGEPIREDAVYDEGFAVDIIVDGQPRCDYIETDQDIEREQYIEAEE